MTATLTATPREEPVRRDLFVYIDESGNFDFSPGGTAWFYVSALSTFTPSFGLAGWHAIKLDAFQAGSRLEELKASEDKQAIRDRVFELLGSGAGTVRVDAIAIEKAKANPVLRPPERLYQANVERLVQYVIAGRRGTFNRLFVFLDTIPVTRKRQAVVGALKTSIATMLPTTPYEVLERDSRGEHLLQLSDYCSWALYVARARGETRPKAAIRPIVHSDFSIFRTGTVRYY